MAKLGVGILQGICFKAQGDVGPMTSYTNKRGIVMFLKAWLRDPVSPDQVAHRNRIRACARNWQTLTKQQKAQYENVTKRLSLYINGYNLWVCLSMNNQARDAAPTLRRQSFINFPMPPKE